MTENSRPRRSGGVTDSSAFDERVERALEPRPIDLREDTRELLNPLYGILDRSLEAIIRRHGLPPNSASPLRGWAKVVVRAIGEEGDRVRSEPCASCGTPTNNVLRVLKTLPEHSSFTREDSDAVRLTPVSDGLEIAVDVDASRLSGVLSDVAELGRWLAKGVAERAGGVASAQVCFVEDSFRL